ncbi:MAG: hypothetical protein AAGB48_11790 [Planctomycetota bacterium]
MDATIHETCTQAYQTILLDRALHPESFDLRDRRVFQSDAHELEAWIMPGSHLLRFESRDGCVSELVIDRDSGVLGTDAVASFLCAGDRDAEQEFAEARMRYMTSVQTESLTENLYASTMREMLEHAEASGCLRFEWETDAGPNISMVDVQAFNREVHAQAYHLIARGGFVLRTQTLFELLSRG